METHMKTTWVSVAVPRLVRPLAIIAVFFYAVSLNLFLPGSAAYAQISGAADVNTSKKGGADGNCAIIKNPKNKKQLFAACNTEGPGLFAARSNDLGETWQYYDAADKTIADGGDGFDKACCDPTLAWDIHGNLYLGYVGAEAMPSIEMLLSTDGGVNFTILTGFDSNVPSDIMSQPTLAVEEITGAAIAVPTASVWLAWNLNGEMYVMSANITAADSVNAGKFGMPQVITGTTDCNFGDIAISLTGVVVQVCQTTTSDEGQTSILVNTDPDGVGPMPFGPATVATTTNVGVRDLITPQNFHGIDAEAGLAYDRFGPGGLLNFPGPSPHEGRLYLVYTDEVVDESNDTDIMVRYSENDGVSWSDPPIRVNDDATVRSQFLPKIATNRLSGNIAVCWLDARDSATNDAVRQTCSMATPADIPTFFDNVAIGDAESTSTGLGDEFGDYSGLTYFRGRLHPIWADTSNSTSDNPDGSTNFDAYTDVVGGGSAAMEGDPHMTTIDGISYDFHGAGEFVSLRGDGLEIQVRHRAVYTNFFPGATDHTLHTGIATCVSLNSAVAAQVGPHRVSYQPDISGVPDPNGLQLRVDGVLTTLGASGLDFGDGGRIVKSAVGDHGIEIGFPNGTTLMVTPKYWTKQKHWYMNVNVYNTTAAEGTMGAIAPRKNRWLPALPDGTSLGPRPFDLSDRYDVLYNTFAEAWRVNDSTSLFDYAPGTSTSDFTLSGWPRDNPPCLVPDQTPAMPLDPSEAQTACAAITDDNRRANCVFDVQLTGELGFAETYLLTQQLEAGATTTTVNDNVDQSRREESVTFGAKVVRTASRDGDTPTGTVQFVLDGDKVGSPVALDRSGRATWVTSDLATGDHQIAASYAPTKGSVFLASSSLNEKHRVNEAEVVTTTADNRIIWIVIALIILALLGVWWIRRP
jgi:hypothetical protein